MNKHALILHLNAMQNVTPRARGQVAQQPSHNIRRDELTIERATAIAE